ncbi:hypothetical protein MAH1_28540 [Sessilibacter sp. MAH1]
MPPARLTLKEKELPLRILTLSEYEQLIIYFYGIYINYTKKIGHIVNAYLCVKAAVSVALIFCKKETNIHTDQAFYAINTWQKCFVAVVNEKRE